MGIGEAALIALEHVRARSSAAFRRAGGPAARSPPAAPGRARTAFRRPHRSRSRPRPAAPRRRARCRNSPDAVADGEDGRRALELGTDVEDGLRPAPVGRPQERERRLRHARVLGAHVRRHDFLAEVLAQPGLVGLGGLVMVICGMMPPCNPRVVGARVSLCFAGLPGRWAASDRNCRSGSPAGNFIQFRRECMGNCSRHGRLAPPDFRFGKPSQSILA